MNVTTCICTMKRPDDLARALAALRECEPPPTSILVSDDSPADDRRSEAVCAQFDAVIYQTGPRRGLSANRNACLDQAATEYIHFIDDDVIVPPDFYRRSADALRVLQPRVIVTGFEWSYPNNPTQTPIRLMPPYCGFWPHLKTVDPSRANCIVINAAIFPWELFRENRFDENMKYGCEESDITLQGIKAGYKLHFDENLFVSHYSSAVNRDQYANWVIASQVYAGLKRQWFYQNSGARTLAFAVVAIPRLLLYQLRHRGPAACIAAARQVVKGTSNFWRLAAKGV